jgi:NSS family neurotransmitter:Na+ symporter
MAADRTDRPAQAGTAGRQDHWSGRAGFLLATIGSAVGIGSIWKFPYEAGANGGGTFVLFYLAGLALVVVPLMLAEFVIGRIGQADCASSMARVADMAGHPEGSPVGRRWALIGVLGVLTGFLILSFYAVIGGWTLGYALETLMLGLPGSEVADVQQRYDRFLAAPGRMLLFHAVFMGVTVAIVARGIAGGIETASKVLMPILLALMLGLAGYSMIEGDAMAALRFLFVPDPAYFTARTALDALGLGFFSIGVGQGLMITYAAFAGPRVNLREIAFWSVLADTGISLLAGMAVFPLVFAFGLDPASGPGLVFVTLPLAFARMPFGTLAAIAFFLLLFVAALGSAISLLELVVALLRRRTGWSQARAAVLAGGTCFVAGFATVLSFNLWSDWHPLAGQAWAGALASGTFFDVLDHVTSNLLLTLTGLGMVVFAGWVMPVALLAAQLEMSERAAWLMRMLLRWVAPLGIAGAVLASWLS